MGVQHDIDLGAERMIAAEKGQEKIAVEIKTIAGASFVYEFHEALGQYLNYEIGLEAKEPDRELFLAVSDAVYLKYFDIPAIRMAVEKFHLRILTFDPELEIIVQWIK